MIIVLTRRGVSWAELVEAIPSVFNDGCPIPCLELVERSREENRIACRATHSNTNPSRFLVASADVKVAGIWETQGSYVAEGEVRPDEFVALAVWVNGPAG